MTLLVEAAGWIGTLLILAAYIYVSSGRIDGKSPAYQWMNIVGAVGLTINSAWHSALPSVALNAIWLLIGLVALWNIRPHSST